MTSTKSKEIAEEYISSLSDLTINSKPLINMLTMLAEDNVEHATAIVEAVENHLQKVRPDIKLPVLYLIDSIVKNVNGSYLNLFTQNIVNTFCGVFEKVDEATRASMWKLRQTWKDVFPAKKLFSLDVRVQSIDPAWPITASSPTLSSGSIHLNPRFLSISQTTPAPLAAPVKIPAVNAVSVSGAAMREQLLKKQKELLELQKQKIELELLQTKTSLEQQQRQLDKQAATVKSDMILPTAHVIPITESIQGDSVTPVIPSQIAKQVAKQFPAAAASLFKNAGIANGPKIAPVSSLMVASARQASRDPRLKTSSNDSSTSDSRVPRSAKEINIISVEPQITTVLSDQLKQQFITKQAVTSTLQKPTTSNLNVVESSSTINASSNDSPNNNNNKILSGNTSKDALPHHRSSQKKDSRSSNNISNNILTGISPKSSGGIMSQSISTNVGTTMSVNRNSADVKSVQNRRADIGRENKSSERGSRSDKSSSSSSKSSSRKVGGKSRSKLPLASPSKMAKIERDASPVRSKDNSDSSSPNSSRATPPMSKSESSKNRKKIGKSRKRSPSPPYRIPRRNIEIKVASANNSGGLTEEEQSGSLIVSPPHPPTFKDIRQNARQRNYMRRNKEDICSLDVSGNSGGEGADSLAEVASKDEDLRPVLPLPLPLPLPVVVPGSDKKEDLDLRVLPPSTGKRQSTEHLDSAGAKKTKAEKFDALFGNEDVDLRTLTHPKAGRPPTPPPPVISGEENKASWAKIKTPTKSERDKQSSSDEKEKDRPKDRNKDRLGRPRLYNKLSDDSKDRRRPFSDDDLRPGRRNRDLDKPDRNSDRNIEIIMKQAEEQLNQGSISQTEYHKLIQGVWQMNEDRKLRAAQRKEKEIGSIIWEKNLDIGGFSPDSSDMGHRGGKDHGHGRNGPRWPQPWQQPGPWAHQPPFNPDFRPPGPWQGPRGFGPPMRPDFNQFPHGFNSNMGPRMNPNLMGPMNGPPMLPLGVPLGLPPNPMNNLNGPNSILHNNGPRQQGPNIMNHPRNIMTDLSPENCEDMSPENMLKYSGGDSRLLPTPDKQTLDDIGKDTMKSINIDGIPREIRYYGQTGVVFMSWDDPREIGFQDGFRGVLVDEKDTVVCAFNEPYKEFFFENEVHRIRLGAPTRELFIDDCWYECYFGGPPIKVDLGNKKVNIKLEGPPPQVKIGTVKRTDLVVAKINLIINARNMVPVFLDSKPQMFEIDGEQHTLEFTDALKTVSLNGRSFPVHFGGLPKPITIGDKKHFIRFSVLPRGVRAGHVRIHGMKGENPPDIDDGQSSNSNSENKISNDQGISTNSMSSLPSFENDTNSQDGNDNPSGSKPDLQLDMLSSALSSAMAPSSGLSYQAEPTENKTNTSNNSQSNPILPLNLNLNDLFQRLVETGIVPQIGKDAKKSEEEIKKEPKVIPVTFDKPETLKVKQPAMVSALYSGMQCSSCGVRFAPELATKYSQHLDWHFRQNRRERDLMKKAHSRPWYYDLTDWIQFEEIEDLEDRVQSWFETEKQSAETEGANNEDCPQEAMQPSVPTGTDDDTRCQVCHDTFEQFYNEEKEEWHLRPAVVFEEKNYHPLCLEDHKQSMKKSALALEESLIEMEEEKKEIEIEESVETPTDEPKVEESEPKDEPTADENSEEVKDEVSKEVSETKSENVEVEPKDEEDEEVVIEQDVNKEEKTDAETIDLEAMETESEEKDSNEKEGENEVTEDSFAQVKVKEEPVDAIEGEEQSFDFANVEVKVEPVEAEPEPEETVLEGAVVDNTMTAVTSSIDGNVELESAQSTIPSAASRIKINITKPLVTNKEPEESKEKPQAETPVEDQTPLQPAAMKPSLQGRKFSVLPPVEKGHEMSGLCSIM